MAEPEEVVLGDVSSDDEPGGRVALHDDVAAQARRAVIEGTVRVVNEYMRNELALKQWNFTPPQAKNEIKKDVSTFVRSLFRFDRTLEEDTSLSCQARLQREIDNFIEGVIRKQQLLQSEILPERIRDETILFFNQACIMYTRSATETGYLKNPVKLREIIDAAIAKPFQRTAEPQAKSPFVDMSM